MMLAHRHAERPGHVLCVPGDGRPAQGVMRPHAPQAVVRPNQALRRLPRQGPPLPERAGRCRGLCRYRDLLDLKVHVRIPALKNGAQLSVERPHARL
jgi:hypothetical protein